MGNKITRVHIPLLVPLFLLVVEHVGRINDIEKRPSYFLEIFSKYAKDTFEFIGAQFARLSSFVLYLQMDKIMITLRDVLKPTFNIIISPFYTLNGYVRHALTYEYKSWQIYLGSAVIMAIFSYIILKKTTFGKSILASCHSFFRPGSKPINDN